MPRSAAGRKVIQLSGVKGALPAHDPRWDSRAVVEVATAAYDTDMLGVGTSPYLGDVAVSALHIPATPSTPSNRYLLRLCAASIPEQRAVVLRGIRQLLTIRQAYPVVETGETFVFEREVVSPLWSFQDANVSWHLRWMKPSQSRRFAADADPAHLPAMSPSSWGLDSALLYAPPAAVYTPLGGGIGPGQDVDYLGTWRDMRYPWDNTDWDLDIPLVGPGEIVLYASVKQTDPDTRATMPVFDRATISGWRPEDQFLFSHDRAIYGHVAGALLLELYPNVKEFSP